MKNRRKYHVCRILLILTVVSLMGCSGKETAGSAGTYWILETDLHTYGEQGIFYQESGYLRFMDAASGLDVTVCDRPECSHSKEECPAYFEGRVFGTFWEDDKLYLLTDYGANRFGELYLYEASVNGEDRRQLAELGDAQYIFKAVFTERYIVIAYTNQYDENMKDLPEDRTGVRVYDRETGECRDIWSREGWNALTYQLYLIGDEIYYACHYYDLTAEDVLAHETDRDYTERHAHIEVLRADVEGREIVSLLQDIQEVQGVCEAGVFYTADDSLYLLNPETGDSRDLGEQRMGYPSFSGNGSLFSAYDSDTREMSYYLYEADAGEMRPIAKMRDCLLAVVFENITYAYDYDTDDGGGSLAFCRTKDFLKGKTDGFIRFEQ